MTRRSEYEVVIRPGARLQVKRRTAVTVIYAPNEEAATQKLLELMGG